MTEARYELVIDVETEKVTVTHQGRKLEDRDALGVMVVGKTLLERKLRWEFDTNARPA